MAATGALVHRGLAWLFILLAFCGWVIMLSGVAALQQACSGQMLTHLVVPTEAPGGALPLNYYPGTVGYLAPVSCGKFFSYTWWITFFNMFMLILLAVGVTGFVGRFRGGLVALSAVLLVLLMNTANTYLYFNHIAGLTGSVPSRARVIVAGSIISAIAYFIIIAIVGWHNEDVVMHEPYDTEATGKKKPARRGGLFGLGIGKKKKAGEEEHMGAGTAGSPRMVQVPQPRPVVQPVPSSGGGAYQAAPVMGGSGSPRLATTAVPTTGSPVMHMPAGGTTTYTTTTTTAVPLSTDAAPVRHVV